MDCVCAIQRVNGKDTNVSVFERGMVVGPKRTCLYQELQRRWVFHAQQFPVCIKNDPPPKGHPAILSQLLKGLE